MFVLTVKEGEVGSNTPIDNPAQIVGSDLYYPPDVVIGTPFNGVETAGTFRIISSSATGVVYYSLEQCTVEEVEFPDQVRPMLSAIWDELGSIQNSLGVLSAVVSGSVVVNIASIALQIQQLDARLSRIERSMPAAGNPFGFWAPR